MTENNKIVISRVNNKYILCHIVNDKATELIAYDSVEESMPVGTIINGVIEKKLDGIDACFIRYAPKKSGYIDAVYKGQTMIPVMYKKEQKGKKNALFTDKLSITGEYIVVFEGETFVRASAKINKNKSKELIDKYTCYAGKHSVGLLLRTSCAEANENLILNEIDELCSKLEHIRNISASRVQYSVLYRPSPEIVTECLDIIKRGADEIVTDCDEVYDLIKEDSGINRITDRVNIRKYADELLPLYKLYAFESKISEALSRVVYLKSGANITFDQTEALMAIDVNSSGAKYKGDKERSVLNVNIEAATEIFRQARLRNLSGIIIVDFINMVKNESYDELAAHIRKNVACDKYSFSFHGFTNLGLAEFTRQKVKSRFDEQMR